MNYFYFFYLNLILQCFLFDYSQGFRHHKSRLPKLKAKVYKAANVLPYGTWANPHQQKSITAPLGKESYLSHFNDQANYDLKYDDPSPFNSEEIISTQEAQKRIDDKIKAQKQQERNQTGKVDQKSAQIDEFMNEVQDDIKEGQQKLQQQRNNERTHGLSVFSLPSYISKPGKKTLFLSVVPDYYPAELTHIDGIPGFDDSKEYNLQLLDYTLNPT